jgi:hypothetical protein
MAALKEVKSDVICDQGQLYKISKNKDGVVKKDRHDSSLIAQGLKPSVARVGT